MSEQAARFVGTIPEHYDNNLGPRIFNDYAADLASRVAALEPGIVLELAAGTGIATRALRDRLSSECKLVATDLNAPMLDIARTKFEDGERVRFEQADAMSLDYDDDSIDVIACQFGVMFFPDKRQSYRESLRVLRPGGRYVFNAWGPWSRNPFAELAHEVASEFFPGDPPGFYKVPFHYHDGNEIETDLRAAGFGDVRIADVELTSEIPSAEHFAKGLVFGNPLFEEVETRGGNPDDLVAAVAESIANQLGSSMPLHALVVEAQKPD